MDPQLLWNAFGRVIDPPIIHTPVMDSVRFGLGVGAARGVGRVVSWLDRIASVNRPEGTSSVAAGRARFSRKDELMYNVENRNLKNTIRELYRGDARIGDGGTASAVRHELATGELVGGKSHLSKARQRITNLERIIQNENLSKGDLEIAQQLLDDLINAVGGR
ncbi:MAG: hypothetical protein FWE20_12015 [Defluviitaleaceae bacterium]|nr:hypothetical protein [Defluviitaleaceae bacterium]